LKLITFQTGLLSGIGIADKPLINMKEAKGFVDVLRLANKHLGHSMGEISVYNVG
jgi:hypothetical protein